MHLNHQDTKAPSLFQDVAREDADLTVDLGAAVEIIDGLDDLETCEHADLGSEPVAAHRTDLRIVPHRLVLLDRYRLDLLCGKLLRAYRDLVGADMVGGPCRHDG